MLNATLEKCVYNTFTDVVRYTALSFGDRSCVSKKGRTGEGGWIHFQAEKAAHVSFIKIALVGTGRPAHSLLYCTMG